AMAYQHEFANGHDDATQDNAPSLPEEAIGHYAAKEWGQIHAGRVDAVDLVGELLVVERTKDPSETVLERKESRHVGCHIGARKVLCDVEDEQSSHPVKAKALPHLGEKQDVQAN